MVRDRVPPDGRRPGYAGAITVTGSPTFHAAGAASVHIDVLEPHAAPADDLEAKLAEKIGQLWGELLGHAGGVRVDANFFDLGGSSLLAVRALARLRQQGHDVSLVDLYAYPTVRALARALAGGGAKTATAARPARRSDSRGAGEDMCGL